jgi:protein-disulfide isomerase
MLLRPWLAVPRTTAVALAFALVASGPGLPALAQTPSTGGSPTSGKTEPAARVGNDVITVEQLEHALSGQLAELERQRQELLHQKLGELIAELVVAQEAAKQGVSVEQLFATHADGSAAEVTDAEVTSFIIQNRAGIPAGMDEREVKAKVRNYLRVQNVGKARQAYAKTLRDRTTVSVLLKEPPIIRVAVSADKGIARGPRDARVTIVEFTDFQCPFCKRANGIVHQVLADYKDRVKLVFRDFPIVSLHPGAPRAHQAARCANAQGKFWEYREVLFERSPQHAEADLKRYAQDLKLDAAAFAECLDSKRYEGEVNADVQEGLRLGISGTPTFFINGRQVVGAQPIEEFKKIIDRELATN